MIKRILLGGIFAGVIFYALSLTVLGLFKFLPIVPLAVGIPKDNLQGNWYLIQAFLSLGIGILWAAGHALLSSVKKGGFIYAAAVYFAAIFPAFIFHLIVAQDGRSLIAYGMVVTFIGAILGGKAVSIIVNRR